MTEPTWDPDAPDSPTALVPASMGSATAVQRPLLTPQQREAARLMVAEDITFDEIALRLHVTRRTVYNWRCLPAFRHHLKAVADEALDDTRTTIKAHLARKGMGYIR
jgi:predicted DNA-binding protein (UPF0251 family)